MYLDEIAAKIRPHIPPARLPSTGAAELIRWYAVLLRIKGIDVSQSDVHDVWSAWMVQRDPNHVSLVPYKSLPASVQEEDRVFATAIRRTAAGFARTSPSLPSLSEVLFPEGPPKNDTEKQQALDLYKVMVASSEGLVNRRQGVNTFFLTINGALLTASGVIVQSAGSGKLSSMGIAVLALAGAILCAAWRSLIVSFGQLNRGKFKVINAIELYLKAAIYAAEWEALGRGADPKTYRSFTSREIWVPNALLVLHILTAIVAAMFASEVLRFDGRFHLIF